MPACDRGCQRLSVASVLFADGGVLELCWEHLREARAGPKGLDASPAGNVIMYKGTYAQAQPLAAEPERVSVPDMGEATVATVAGQPGLGTCPTCHRPAVGQMPRGWRFGDWVMLSICSMGHRWIPPDPPCSCPSCNGLDG